MAPNLTNFAERVDTDDFNDRHLSTDSFTALSQEIYGTVHPTPDRPVNVTFESLRGSPPPPPATPHIRSGVFKVFLGGLCFEMGPHALQAVLWNVCGVRVLIEHIDLFTKDGRNKGCGTVFVTSEADRDTILSYDRRLLFTPTGVWSAQTPETLRTVVEEVVCREYKGPRHPAVIEPTKTSSRPFHSQRA